MKFSYETDAWRFIPGPFPKCERKHPDYLYAAEHFLKGHSCSYRVDSKKPLKILHLYTKNKFQIFLYNIILFIRFYIRRLLNYVKNK